MPKKKKRNINQSKETLQELQNSRDGGQTALRGFTYQLLYSCYLILSELNSSTSFFLEGIEDVDQVKHELDSGETIHIQIKAFFQ